MMYRMTSHTVKRLPLYIGCLYFCVSMALAQTEINMMSFHDGDDEMIKQSIDAAVKYLNENPKEGVKVNNHYSYPFQKEKSINDSLNEMCQTYDSTITAGNPPHVTIDATKSGVTSESVKVFTRGLGLPTFSASYGQTEDLREWSDLDANQQKYLVQLMPPGDIVAQLIRDIVIEQGNSDAGIIYDDSVVMDHKYKSLLVNVPCRHIITKVAGNDSAIRDQVGRLKTADIVYYFVLGTPDTIRKVLNAGTAHKMYGKKYSWYAITKDEGKITCGCDEMKVVVYQPKYSKSDKELISSMEKNYQLTSKPAMDSIFYFNLAVRGMKAAASLAKSGAYDNFQFDNCVSFDDTNIPSRPDINLRKEIEKVSLDSLGDINWNGNGMSYMVYDMSMTKLMIRKGNVDKSITMGIWSTGMPGKSSFVTGMSTKDNQAVKVYKITTVVQPPFIMKKEKDGKVEFYGYCIDLIDEIKQLVGFEYVISEAPDKKFGTMNDNEEWNGMIKELIDQNAEIALAPLSVMAERENVVDFTVPYYDLVGITILMEKPKAETSLFRFLTVLEPEVWGCILVAYGFTSILLFFFDKFSPYSYQNNRDKYVDDDEKREFTFKECLWFCMTSLTPQGGGEAPKNLSGRLVAATWWLFGFIIIASYTANLAAFLTVSRLDTPIESLDDLANQYKVQYAPMNGTATMTYFERMEYIEKKFYEIWKDMSLNDSMSSVERAKLAVWDYPVSDKYTKMWQSMQEAGLPSDFKSALARVRSSTSSSEGFAYLGDATDIRYQVLTNCDLQIVGEEFSRKPYAIAVQQGSPLKDQFNDAILKLLNQRKLETLKERWWNQNPEKKVCEDEDDQSDGISIENIGGVFIVIFVGIGLACITLAFEYWYYRKRNNGSVSSSTQVLSVRQFGADNKGYMGDQTNFNAEYKQADLRRDPNGIAAVGNPW